MKKINTQEIPVKSTFVSLWMTVAMVLAFTGCSEEDLVQPANSQAGTLHITSVSVDGQQVGGRSRAVAEGITDPVSINNLPANHSITGFSAGDEIELFHDFYSEGGPIITMYTSDGRTWQPKNGFVIKPGYRQEWEEVGMEAWVASRRDLNNIPDYVLADGIQESEVELLSDNLFASTNDGSITVDTDLNSPTLGATTIRFKHQDALLRLPIPEEGFNVAGTYVVNGTAYNVTGLATLWACMECEGENDDIVKRYAPLTQVGNNLQAIVSVYNMLAGFKAVMSTDVEDTYLTLDLPFKVGTSTEASTGIELTGNTQYPLTLTLRPNQAQVNLASATGKPGWAVNEEDEEVLTGDNYLTYNAADQYFEVNAPVGLQLLNNWMSGGITTTELKAYNFVGCSSVPSEADALSANVRLMVDITLPAPEEGESNWTAIGTSEAPYTGTIDGNGHTLSGMVINTTKAYQGFVGYLGTIGTNGKIKNLTFADAEVTSTVEASWIGIVAGFINGATVENCYTADGSSISGVKYVGGIVGGATNSTIAGCINAATVANTGGGDTAGVAGNTNNSIVIACGNTVAVNATGCSVGGIVGYTYGGMNIASWTIDTTEKDGFDGNDVSEKDGYGDLDGNLTITACYSVASESALNSKLDKMNEALWQYYEDNSATTGLFWKETTDNWPTTVQQEVSGDSNPYMVDLKFIAPTESNDPGGTFEVGNAKGLMILNEWMTSNLDNNENFKAIGFDGSGDIVSITSRMGVDVKLVKDITLPTVGEGESNWKPIKSYNGGYTKTFDGQGHTIRNLTINQPSADKIGLVGQLEAGSVKNLTLENVKIKGNSYVGGIVGRMENSSTVENCSVSGEITSKGVTGGIVANIQGNYGVITGCINHAAINVNFTGDYTCPVGGIVGDLKAGTYCLSCGNTGVITIENRAYYVTAGGIAGFVKGSSSTVCYVTGCWSIETVEKEGQAGSSSNPHYVDSANKDGFGCLSNEPDITGSYTAAKKTEGTEQQYINTQVDLMNTQIQNQYIYANHVYLTKYYWEKNNNGWPTLTTEEPVIPEQPS